MKKVSSTEFRSDYGFSSPNFRVDSTGNITATSLSLSAEDDDTSTADFVFTDDDNGIIFISPFLEINPTLSFAKSRTYRLQLDLDITELFFLKDDQEELITDNITHSSGDVGVAAQGKQSGVISFSIPVNYAEDIIYYTNRERTFYGEINIVDPEGIFSSLEITDPTNSTSSITGALTVVGGVGIDKNLHVGESIFTKNINLDGVGIPVVSSETNLELAANYRIVVKIEDSLLGVIGAEGSTIPINNTTINGTVIGQTTPSTATFTSANVTETPTEINNVTNKTYVDQTVTALAIALGS